MKLSKEIEFQADTESEAYSKARERLGQEGVILSIQTIRVPGLLPFFRKKKLLVRAGVFLEESPQQPERDPELERRQMAVFQALLEHKRHNGRTSDEGVPDVAGKMVQQAQDRLEIGVPAVPAGRDCPLSPDVSPVPTVPNCGVSAGIVQESADPNLKLLLESDIPYRIASSLADEYVSSGGDGGIFSDWLARRMGVFCASENGGFSEALGGRRLMMVGPTGVGKTTTIAKLAALALQEDREVCLFTSDNYRVSAVEQIRTFARVLRIPIEVVNSGAEIPPLLGKYSEEALLIMDTTGHGFRETARVAQISSVYEHFQPDAVHVTVSAASRFPDISASIRRIQEAFPVTHVLLTKLDETTCPGSLVSIPLEFGLPISFVATGQNVPRDIRRPTGEFIARTVLSGGEGK